MAQTRVLRIDPLLDSYFLSLTAFNDVLNGGLNQNVLIGMFIVAYFVSI